MSGVSFDQFFKFNYLDFGALSRLQLHFTGDVVRPRKTSCSRTRPLFSYKTKTTFFEKEVDLQKKGLGQNLRFF